jgi:hypothetical protein
MRTWLKFICPGTKITHCVYLLFKSILEPNHTGDAFTLFRECNIALSYDVFIYSRIIRQF